MPDEPGRRILVVEDDSTLRESLEMFFGGAGYDVRMLPDAQDFDETVAAFQPELFVLDVNLGHGRPTGFALARRVRERAGTPIIFLTALDGLDERLSGFEVGADDYVTKPFSISELHARVRAVLRRADEQADVATVGRDVHTFGDVTVDEDARVVKRGDVEIELTHREFDLLLAFMENPQRVLSRDRLLAMVWGFDEYDPNVVEVFISTLRRKLETHGPRVIQTVRGVGYVLRAT